MKIALPVSAIRAPRLSIRASVPWYWRLLPYFATAVLAFFFGVAIVGGALRSERGLASAETMQKLSELEEENKELRRLTDTSESRQQIERSAAEQLSLQIKNLEQENAGLREDLAFFEGVVPGGGDAAKGVGPQISRFRVVPDGAGRYRYRLLLVQPGVKSGVPFRGELQLVLHVMVGAKESVIVLPSPGAAATKFRVEVKYFQRFEGEFSVAGTLKSAEVRLVSNEAVVARQAVNL